MESRDTTYRVGISASRNGPLHSKTELGISIQKKSEALRHGRIDMTHLFSAKVVHPDCMSIVGIVVLPHECDVFSWMCDAGVIPDAYDLILARTYQCVREIIVVVVIIVRGGVDDY